uniref:Protein kinase domain-containing protein n=1 Tax=Acrobeloides nanus TaxID=290746 RepID=A0A914DXS8_9BILA
MGKVNKSPSESTIFINGLLAQYGYNKQSDIGTGSYSRVWLATSRNHKKLVAIKQIDRRPNSEYLKRFLPRELDLVLHLNHQHVIRVYQTFRTTTYVCMVQEYAPGGDLLQKILSSPHQRLHEGDAKFLFRQLIEGIRYLQSIHVLHRDIKCENLFLDGYGNLKIGDFGFARFLNDGEDTKTSCGSRPYAAFEIMTGQSYSSNAVDIYSAGVALYIMLTGMMPFNDKKKDKHQAIHDRRYCNIYFPQTTVQKHAKELIMAMLTSDPAKRIRTHEIIEHSWLKDMPYQFLSKHKSKPSLGSCLSG